MYNKKLTLEQAKTILREILTEKQLEQTIAKYGGKCVIKATDYVYKWKKINVQDFGTALKQFHYEAATLERIFTPPATTDKVIDPTKARSFRAGWTPPKQP